MRHLRVEVRGIVRGVGFRRFVNRLAREHGVHGFVTADGPRVEIRARGDGDQLFLFLKALKDEAPPASVVDKVSVLGCEPFDAREFRVVTASANGRSGMFVSPDLATCDECLRELFEPGNRRYGYPFTSCGSCGPRFTIIREAPYDRRNTSMARFRMCPECEREYEDPLDRRFGAHAISCPACGPELWLAGAGGCRVPGEPVEPAAELLREGGVLAIKGPGGFHLACDATSDEAVRRLRERAGLRGIPLPVMVADRREAERCCHLTMEEERLLSGPRAPVTLLRTREGGGLSEMVGAGPGRLGVVLPHTPVHHLLMARAGMPLVMTPDGFASQPPPSGDREAVERLSGIADSFLLHDLETVERYDDSVTSVLTGVEYPVRRSRGYAPYPLNLASRAPMEVLGVGPERDNSFCVVSGDRAFLSKHVGDVRSEAGIERFQRALASLERLFSLRPEAVAHDLEPESATTRLALETGLPAVPVQHHHAHVVSCMADNRLDGEVIGVAWDEGGLGEDGTVRGGEFLAADASGYRRLAHLYPYPMPGAHACVSRGYRMVMGVLSELYSDPGDAMDRLRKRFDLEDSEAETMLFQLKNRVNSPLTSSAGRMFDVAAALGGIRSEADCEGQAVRELEATAVPVEAYYSFELDRSREPWVVDTRRLFMEMTVDAEGGVAPGELAGKFHATMALVVIETARALARETGLRRVALSGGIFQNLTLAGWVMEGLESAGLEVYVHRRVPCNDGGLSLGQAVTGAKKSE